MDGGQAGLKRQRGMDGLFSIDYSSSRNRECVGAHPACAKNIAPAGREITKRCLTLLKPYRSPAVAGRSMI
jgi:hypothetical protein